MQSITISVADLKVLLADVVRIELEIFKASINKKTQSVYLSRKQTAAFLQIDLSTLHRWTEDCELKKYKKVGRVYYKRSEVENCLKSKKLAA